MSIKKIENISLALYLTSIPTSIAGMEIFSWLLFLIACATFFSSQDQSFFTKKYIKISSFFLLGFFLAVILSAFINTDLPLEDKIKIIGSARWTLLLAILSGVFLNRLDFLKKYSSFFCGLIFLIGAYASIQSFTGIDFIHTTPFDSGDGTWRARGVFSNVMSYSHIFAMILSILASYSLFYEFKSFRSNLIFLIGMLTVAFSVYATFTRGAWIAAVGSILTISYIRSKKAFGIVAVVIAIAFFTGSIVSPKMQQRLESFTKISEESNSARIDLWRANWEIFKDHPLFGVGYRRNSRMLPQYYEELGIDSKFYSHAHNNYLAILGGTGLIGFSFYFGLSLWLIGFSYLTFRRIPHEQSFAKSLALASFAGQICFQLGGLTEATHYDGETMHALIATIGMSFAAASAIPTQSNM